MNAPQIDLLGVYRLRVTDELVREEAECRSDVPSADELNEVRQELSSIVLVEVLVRHRDAKFDVGDFSQSQEGVDLSMRQVAYAEVYLSPDGTGIVEECREPPVARTLRIAFFLHLWQAYTPLSSSYGDIACPEAQNMPDRLANLISYEGVS